MFAAAAEIPRARCAEFARDDLVEVESGGGHPQHVEKKHEKGETKRDLYARVKDRGEESTERVYTSRRVVSGSPNAAA